jgi:hypothetical protein
MRVRTRAGRGLIRRPRAPLSDRSGLLHSLSSTLVWKERSPMNPLPHPNIERAKSKTVEVQRELEVASAELGLTHGALERELPQNVKQKSDIAWAIRQNAELERKVQQAAEDLEHVTELLEQVQDTA